METSAFSKRETEILGKVTDILVRRFKPGKILLFGSRAKGSFSRGSDFDLAIEGEKPTPALERTVRDEIEKVSGLYNIDLVYLSNVDDDFRNVIIKTGKVVYERRD